MTIKVYENSRRAETCRDILESSALCARFSDMVILPIPSSRDGIRITGGGTLIEKALGDVGRETLVVGYGIPDGAKRLACTLGATVADSFDDERFLLENARLTADAVLGIILTEGARTLQDLKVGIVGLGRIGSALLRSLLFHGATVSVYTTRESVRMMLAAEGVHSEGADSSADLSGIDILVNTAPSPLLVDNPTLPEVGRIMELASGDNFPPDARILRYPSLPSRIYPESAGRIWAESVKRSVLFSGGGSDEI